MNIPNVRAALNAGININPAKSQVVLVSLIVLSAICLISGFGFIYIDNEKYWIPIVIGCILCIVAIVGWFSSQGDIDQENWNPTCFSDATGNALSTDTRALSSPKVVQNIEKVFSALSHREPLPKPDGLIDDRGKPIPNSKNNAEKMIDEINEFVQINTQEANNALVSANSKTGVAQPLIDEPKSDILIKTNTNESKTS